MVVFGQGGCIWGKWLYSGQSCCIREKVVVFGKIGCNRAKWLYSVKVVELGQKWLYSGKLCCILANVVVFGPKRFYPGKLVVFRQLVVFAQGRCIRAPRLYSDKSGCIRAKGDVFGKIGAIRTNCLYSVKSGCNRAKAVLFGQSSYIRAKLLYSWEVDVFEQKWL